MKAKKFILLLTAVLIAAFFSATCYAEKVTLTFWSVNKSEAVEQLVAKFEQENPNIDINTVYVPYSNALTDMVTSFKGNKGPDILTIIQAWAPKLIASGYLIPLDSYIERDLDKSKYLPITWAAFVQDGKTYVAPVRLGTEAVYYNRDLLKEAGFKEPPATWDEFLKWGLAISGPGKSKYVYGMTAKNPAALSYRFLCWLYSAGGDVANADWTRAAINEEPAIKALEFETSLFTKYKVVPPSAPTDGTEEVYLMFVAGTVGSMIRGPLDMFAIYRDYPAFWKDKLVIGSMPGVERGKPGLTTAYAYGLGIGSQTKHPEEAWRFVEFAHRPENMPLLTFGDLPSHRDAFNYPGQEIAPGVRLPYSDPMYQTFLAQSEHVKVMPNNPKWPEVEKAIWDGYQKILAGKTDVRTAADEMAKAINKILEK